MAEKGLRVFKMEPDHSRQRNKGEAARVRKKQPQRSLNEFLVKKQMAKKTKKKESPKPFLEKTQSFDIKDRSSIQCEQPEIHHHHDLPSCILEEAEELEEELDEGKKTSSGTKVIEVAPVSRKSQLHISSLHPTHQSRQSVRRSMCYARQSQAIRSSYYDPYLRTHHLERTTSRMRAPLHRPSTYDQQRGKIEESFVEKLEVVEGTEKRGRRYADEIEKDTVRLSLFDHASSEERFNLLDQEYVPTSLYLPRPPDAPAKSLTEWLANDHHMKKVTKYLGLPNPEDLPPTARPILKKSLKSMTLKDMLQLVKYTEEIRGESTMIKIYVEWAVDLHDDSDIAFYIQTYELMGRRLRYEIANLYETSPDNLIIRQTRAKKKKDDSVVVMTVACNFADLLGNIMMDYEVKDQRVHSIHDHETVPLPGDWRALVQVLDVNRPKIRRRERRRLRMLHEHVKKRVII